MKAVILAGGLGTRISEETHLKTKPIPSKHSAMVMLLKFSIGS
jgi:dTDP-glucose pyrophosphorylase